MAEHTSIRVCGQKVRPKINQTIENTGVYAMKAIYNECGYDILVARLLTVEGMCSSSQYIFTEALVDRPWNKCQSD